MSQPNNRVSVVFRCKQKHDHEICVSISRGVPPELRCPPDKGSGYGGGSGGGCSVPRDLADRVERELRDSFQENKRRRFVLIQE